MSVTKDWLERLPKLSETDALAQIRTKAAELYRANHGRDPQNADERTAGMQLLTEAAERLRTATPETDGYLPGFRPLTIGERRAIDEDVAKIWDRGW